jgi:hypothetical protein
MEVIVKTTVVHKMDIQDVEAFKAYIAEENSHQKDLPTLVSVFAKSSKEYVKGETKVYLDEEDFEEENKQVILKTENKSSSDDAVSSIVIIEPDGYNQVSLLVSQKNNKLVIQSLEADSLKNSEPIIIHLKKKEVE